MAMVCSALRGGQRAGAPAGLALLARAVHGFYCVEAREGPSRIGVDRSFLDVRPLWRGSCEPYASSSRSLFIDATTAQVALQSLSGSEEGEYGRDYIVQRGLLALSSTMMWFVLCDILIGIVVLHLFAMYIWFMCALHSRSIMCMRLQGAM